MQMRGFKNAGHVICTLVCNSNTMLPLHHMHLTLDEANQICTVIYLVRGLSVVSRSICERASISNSNHIGQGDIIAHLNEQRDDSLDNVHLSIQ